MILTGLIIIGVAIILSIINMVVLMGNTARGSEGGMIGGFLFHALCAIAYVVGIILFVVGLLQHFNVI